MLIECLKRKFERSCFASLCADWTMTQCAANADWTMTHWAVNADWTMTHCAANADWRITHYTANADYTALRYLIGKMTHCTVIAFLGNDTVQRGSNHSHRKP